MGTAGTSGLRKSPTRVCLIVIVDGRKQRKIKRISSKKLQNITFDSQIIKVVHVSLLFDREVLFNCRSKF